MRRQDKYPETETFHYFNANPKNRLTTDCYVRAISTVCDIPYSQVVMDLAVIQCSTGYDVGSDKCLDLIMKQYGLTKFKQPRKANNTKYTGSEFCKELAFSNYRYVCNLGGHHIAAIIDCKVWDTWDSTDKCVGNYWTRIVDKETEVLRLR